MSLLFGDIFEAIRYLRLCKGALEKKIVDYVEDRVGKPMSIGHVIKTIHMLQQLVEEGYLLKNGKRYSFSTKPSPPKSVEEPKEEEEEDNPCCPGPGLDFGNDGCCDDDGDKCKKEEEEPEEEESEEEDEPEEECPKKCPPKKPAKKGCCGKDDDEPSDDDSESDDDDDDDDVCDAKESIPDGSDIMRRPTSNITENDIVKLITHNDNPLNKGSNNVILASHKNCMGGKDGDAESIDSVEKVGKHNPKKAGNGKGDKKRKRSADDDNEKHPEPKMKGHNHTHNHGHTHAHGHDHPEGDKKMRDEHQAKNAKKGWQKEAKNRSKTIKKFNPDNFDLSANPGMDLELMNGNDQHLQNSIKAEMEDMDVDQEVEAYENDGAEPVSSAPPAGMEKKESLNSDIEKYISGDIKPQTLYQGDGVFSLLNGPDSKQSFRNNERFFLETGRENHKRELSADGDQLLDGLSPSLCSLCEKKKRIS